MLVLPKMFLVIPEANIYDREYTTGTINEARELAKKFAIKSIGKKYYIFEANEYASADASDKAATFYTAEGLPDRSKQARPLGFPTTPPMEWTNDAGMAVPAGEGGVPIPIPDDILRGTTRVRAGRPARAVNLRGEAQTRAWYDEALQGPTVPAEDMRRIQQEMDQRMREYTAMQAYIAPTFTTATATTFVNPLDPFA